MNSISQEAASTFWLAQVGEVFSRFLEPLMTILFITMSVALVLLTIQFNGRRAANLLISFGVFVFLVLTRANYSDALLFDAIGANPAQVKTVSVSGGGCTPTRTQLGFDDGELITVKGSFSVSPGATTVRKATKLGSYICTGEANSTHCMELE